MSRDERETWVKREGYQMRVGEQENRNQIKLRAVAFDTWHQPGVVSSKNDA